MRASKSAVLAAAMLAGCLPAYAQTDAHQIIDTVIADNCATGAGKINPSGVIETDLTGDGVADLVINHRAITCSDGNFTDSCGFRACNVEIWVARDDTMDLRYDVLSIGVSLVEGDVPGIQLTSHNFEKSVIRWNGTDFVSSNGTSAGAVAAPSTAGNTNAAVGKWRYGTHPVLGPSAYVDLGDGKAIGLACEFHGTGVPLTGVVSLRVTKALLNPDGSFTYAFPQSGAVGTNTPATAAKTDGGYSSWIDTTCGANVLSFRKDNNFITTTATVGAVTPDSTTFVEGGQSWNVSPKGDYSVLPNLQTIGLKGSAAAIGQLMKACPAIRQDIEWNCGI